MVPQGVHRRHHCLGVDIQIVYLTGQQIAGVLIDPRRQGRTPVPGGKVRSIHVAVIVFGGLHHPILMEAHLIFSVLLLFVQPQRICELQMLCVRVPLICPIELLHFGFQGVHVTLTQQAE